MRFFFDTEFIEDGKTIDLISIGIVTEVGLSYYAENSECDRSRASDWVKQNVLTKLLGEAGKPRAQIAAEIKEWVGEKPEFWAYYADYDWVVLCQLYGTMMDLPTTWPKFCRDLKQLADFRGARFETARPINAHNALADAEWVRCCYLALKERD